MRGSPRLLSTAGLIVVLLVGAACGSDDGGSSPDLSEAGERGRSVAASNGCAACHGSKGQGGAGPAWTGLAGSMVELDDGTIVVADDTYLATAVTDPSAQLRADYTLKMPLNSLDDSQVNDVIAYIHDLSPDPNPDG